MCVSVCPSLSPRLTWTCGLEVLPGVYCTDLPVYIEKKSVNRTKEAKSHRFSHEATLVMDPFLSLMSRTLLQTDALSFVSAVFNRKQTE